MKSLFLQIMTTSSINLLMQRVKIFVRFLGPKRAFGIIVGLIIIRKKSLELQILGLVFFRGVRLKKTGFFTNCRPFWLMQVYPDSLSILKITPLHCTKFSFAERMSCRKSISSGTYSRPSLLRKLFIRLALVLYI